MTARPGEPPVTEQVAAEQELFAERERYRTLVAQAPIGIFLADPTGATLFVNERSTQIFGRSADELTERGWVDLLHPEDRAVAAGWQAAADTGAVWDAEYRVVVDGAIRWVRTTARPLHDAAARLTGYLGVTADVTERQGMEEERRRGAVEHAAREVADAATARIRSLVDGLAAILWEADARTFAFTFVSERAEQLLGHPVHRWLGDPHFRPSIIHPEDRAAAVGYCAARTAACEDHDVTYRALTADGRVLWMHDVVHVVCDEGAPVLLQGVTTDVTVQKRAERSAAVLAEAGRLLSGPESPERKLAALARQLVGEFGDAAVVSVCGPDGLFRRVAAAHPDPAVVDRLLALAPTRLPADLIAQFLPGRPLVVPISEELTRAAARDEADVAARTALGALSVLVVPLVAGDEVLGLLGFPTLAGPRAYDEADLELAAELGRRAAVMVEAARAYHREQQRRQVSADLSSAGTVAEAGSRLVDRMAEMLGSASASVYVLEPDQRLRAVHALGYPPESLADFAFIRPDNDVPLAATVRTGEPVWLRDRAELEERYPHLRRYLEMTGNQAAAALPLLAGGRVVGSLALSFATPRRFGAAEQAFMLDLVALAAPAFERALVADQRREVAETLQQSLLPRSLPRLSGLALAAHYRPGAVGVQAGGDWYDVLALDADRVAFVVGDVVGQGAPAAAVMGQLRSAFAGYLIEGHPPGVALDRLNTFARTVEGALGSTASCLVLDRRDASVLWARAGHPPPLVVDAGGARYLEGATGTVLGLRDRPPSVAATARLAPGTSVLLYTDGLVERRDEVIDDGLDRLATVAAGLHDRAPASLTGRLLTGCLDGAGTAPADDIALVVARVLPPAFERTVPARPERLHGLRADVHTWAAAAGLGEDAGYDLQLALGEAAANAVEHAYRGAVGDMDVHLSIAEDGAVQVRVRDRGQWRVPPSDAGFRGRGLGLIRSVGVDVVTAPDAGGTEVRFRIRSGLPDAVAPPVRAPAPGPVASTSATVHRRPDGSTRVAVAGDLDITGAGEVRSDVLGAVEDRAAVEIDLTATAYLASAGVTLLADVVELVAAGGGKVTVVVRPSGVVARVLALTGLDGPIRVIARG